MSLLIKRRPDRSAWLLGLLLVCLLGSFLYIAWSSITF